MSKTRHRYRGTKKAKSPPPMSYTKKADGQYVYKPLSKTQRAKSLKQIRKYLEMRERVPKTDTDLLVNFSNNAPHQTGNVRPPPPTERPPSVETGISNALLDLKRGKYDGKRSNRK